MPVKWHLKAAALLTGNDIVVGFVDLFLKLDRQINFNIVCRSEITLVIINPNVIFSV